MGLGTRHVRGILCPRRFSVLAFQLRLNVSENPLRFHPAFAIRPHLYFREFLCDSTPPLRFRPGLFAIRPHLFPLRFDPSLFPFLTSILCVSTPPLAIQGSVCDCTPPVVLTSFAIVPHLTKVGLFSLADTLYLKPIKTAQKSKFCVLGAYPLCYGCDMITLRFIPTIERSTYMIYNTTLCRTNDNTAHEFAMLKVLVAMLNNPELTPEESRKIYNDFYDPMFAILKGEGQE